MKFYQIALFSAATVAAAQHHNHLHRHPARHGSPVEARDAAAVTETVPGPIVTVYELDGQDISYDDVEQGLKDGKYILIGDTISTVIPATTSAAPTTSSTPTPKPSSTSEAAEFFQEKASTSSTSTPTPTTSATPTPTTSSESSSTSSSSSSSSSGNVNAEFPSGTIPCSTFPSEYGAVYVDWLGLEGWTGIQQVPGFAGDLSTDTPITYIATAVSGSGGCSENNFCSYACPAGYQKSQWPASQGSTGQSVGGLYCNSNGMLELSRPSVSQICVQGAGGVQVTNNLSQNVAICRTDYPGTEAETVPLNTEAGGTYPLTNVNSASYYTWEGSSTTAQYYINPQGASVSDACCWGSAGTNLGNWAPVNAGVGQGSDGVTFISLFPNVPTNPDGTLDYTIKITGDVSGSCEYTGGKYYSNGVESSTGCTVSVTSGGTATFDLS